MFYVARMFEILGLRYKRSQDRNCQGSFGDYRRYETQVD